MAVILACNLVVDRVFHVVTFQITKEGEEKHHYRDYRDYRD